MAFNAINRQFKSAAEFAAWLAVQPRPEWPIGSVLHNTFRPTESQWAGLASMKSMQATYEAKGWTSGPHCYLAVGSPFTANDGVWVMTPPMDRGTHAGQCNATRWGIELVGDFATKPPSLVQQQLVIDVLTALHRWAGCGPNIVGHRDCMAGRTCPGDAYYALLPSLRQRLADRLSLAGKYIARHTQAIFEAPAPDAKIAISDTAQIVEGRTVDIDEVKNGWGHLTNGVGFVPIGVLTKL